MIIGYLTRKQERESGGSLKPVGSDFRCPVCKQRGTYIRTRYFETGTADVWTCNDPKCRNYMLYFYDDHPNTERSGAPSVR